jgi:hypothetical protein
MNGIIFNRAVGGLGRRLAGEDHVSGLIVPVTGFQESSMALFRTIEEAEAEGITAEEHSAAHYHISEFFRLAEGAKLYVMLCGELDGSYTEIKTLQSFAAGSIRQVGILQADISLSSVVAELGAIQAVCAELAATNMPLSAVVSPRLTSANLTALPDIHVQNAPRVSVVIAADGGGYGAWLQKTGPYAAKSLGALGTVLGAIAKSRVSDSIGWVEKYNVVTIAYPKTLTGGETQAREMDVPALADGTLISAMTPAQIQSVAEKGYVFLIKHVGATGSYWNDGFTADALTSDYAYIENNRVIDKACRGVYLALLPKISGPAYVDPETGFLTADTVAVLEALGEAPLEQMQRDGELSGFLVSIDPEQPVLSTSKLNVTIKLVPVGVLREIVVSIGFALNVGD